MKKIILLSFVAALAASAPALNFFGIQHDGNTTDSIINLIASLAEGDEVGMKEYYGRLQRTAPKLAAGLEIDELKMPCIHCRGTGTIKEGETCPVCTGTGMAVDLHALGYLQHKFSDAVEAGKSDAAAWKEAKTEFDKRRKLFLTRQTMFGTVIRNEGRGVLLARSGTNETVFVTGYDSVASREGMNISGFVWPAGIYTYEADGGDPVKVKRFVANLWVDFK
ncbi:MAG: hypothetical protein K9M45_11360 [Kiritimatiellales bacterium]|nr:hypothetical protein [Kiritimatiellales bacterium]